MPQTISDFTTGEIRISEAFNISASEADIDATPYFKVIGDEYIMSFVNLEKVKKFTNFKYSAEGIVATRYLTTSYRVSRDSNKWTEWLELDEEIDNFIPFDPLDKMYIDIRFVRSGTKETGEIRLLTYNLNGELLVENTEGVVNSGKSTIIKPPYIYKVFKINDIEVVTSSDITDVSIKWRFSQDNSRSWSDWEPLTKENISTKRINPIRFFQIEYLITNDSSSTIQIKDINLIGDFQNVSLDSIKTNLYGIRECCQSFLLASPQGGLREGIINSDGIFIPNTSGTLSPITCSAGSPMHVMTDEEKAKLYNPYQQSQAMDLLNKLSNDAVEITGFKVQYFVTDPDSKGIDYTLHEFGTFQIVCEDEIKISVEGNQFPDNQIVMNQFDLTLFDSFEVHITKQSFKQLFGPQRRPSKEDLVYFCDINRLFIVDHAQPFRSFNNAAIYYKVVLKKYNKSANVIAGNKSIEDRISTLTNNSTIDQLFGIENEQDKASVANKPQLRTLTRDLIRLEYKADIIRELIENSTTIISKQHYDFSNLLSNGFISLTQSLSAVTYKNLDPVIKVSDNIGYYVWFKINNYTVNDTYNLFNYYDDTNQIGYKINLSGDNVVVNLNTDSYTFSFTGSTGTADDLYEDIWYCYVVNIDQRNRKLNQWIYKRDVDIDSENTAHLLTTTILQEVYSNTQDIIPIEFELEDIDAKILASDAKMTNIRLFSDIIPESEHNKILNQYIIADDSKYLIFADNANQKITLGFSPYHGDDI